MGLRIPSAIISQIPIDLNHKTSDNFRMSTEIVQTDVMDDIQAVADAVAARRPVDPAVAERVRERSRKAQEELLKKFGVREIAVDLTRTGREE